MLQEESCRDQDACRDGAAGIVMQGYRDVTALIDYLLRGSCTIVTYSVGMVMHECAARTER